jgi:hypothetical protein
MWRKGQKRNPEVASAVSEESPACLLNYFARWLRKGSGPQNEKRTQTMHFDAETESRIKKWLLDSNLSDEKTSQFSVKSDSSWLQMSDVSSCHECGDSAASTPNKPLLATDGALATVRNKERNRNRWKGRLPANQSDIPSTFLPSDVSTAPMEVLVHPHALPEPHGPITAQPQALSDPATRRLVPAQSSETRGIGAGRVISGGPARRGRQAAQRPDAPGAMPSPG